MTSEVIQQLQQFEAFLNIFDNKSDSTDTVKLQILMVVAFQLYLKELDFWKLFDYRSCGLLNKIVTTNQSIYESKFF